MHKLINTPQTKLNTSNSSVISIIYIGEMDIILQELNALDNQKYSLTHYDNAIIAFNDIKTEPINADVVICDAITYGISSFDLYKMIRRIEGINPAYVLVTNKKLPVHYVQTAYNLKVDDVIEVPFKTSLFLNRLQFLIKEKKRNRKSIPLEKPKIKIKANYAKRAFDIVFSAFALLMLSPILLLVALLIKIDSKGPVFFISKRVGAGYKVFNFFKFRSMKTGAENLIDTMKEHNQYKVATANEEKKDACEYCEKLGFYCSPVLLVDGKNICERSYMFKKKNGASSFMKFKNDPRVTKLGQFLRKSSIDELPQLLNILKGDMSFVGNRPLPIYEAEQLTTDEWAERFNAPAGLTGLWQVTKRGKSNMSEEERKQLDNTYAKTHSFWGDIYLILKTFPALTQKESV